MIYYRDGKYHSVPFDFNDYRKGGEYSSALWQESIRMREKLWHLITDSSLATDDSNILYLRKLYNGKAFYISLGSNFKGSVEQMAEQMVTVEKWIDDNV